MDLRASRARLGYEAPIRLALTQRVCHFGAPRMYTYTWLITCGWLGIIALAKLGVRWVLVLLVGWGLGQALLAFVTYWNINWDNALFTRWRRRYQRYYRAG